MAEAPAEPFPFEAALAQLAAFLEAQRREAKAKL